MSLSPEPLTSRREGVQSLVVVVGGAMVKAVWVMRQGGKDSTPSFFSSTSSSS